MKRWQWLVALMVSLLGTAAQAAPFYASKDGSMVWDEATGLVWARCSLGQTWTGKTCAGDGSKHTFDEAQAAAKGVNAAGGLGDAKDWGVVARAGETRGRMGGLSVSHWLQRGLVSLARRSGP